MLFLSEEKDKNYHIIWVHSREFRLFSEIGDVFTPVGFLTPFLEG
jgi:hypothetical protein